MNAYTDRQLLFTNSEYAAAQRFLAHQYEDDPTLEAPELTDDDAPDAEAERRNFSDDPRDHEEPLFPPLSCQCGAMSVSGVTADQMTREWARADVRGHHMGRPCRSGRATL